jgi:hypothetical protein
MVSALLPKTKSNARAARWPLSVPALPLREPAAAKIAGLIVRKQYSGRPFYFV